MTSYSWIHRRRRGNSRHGVTAPSNDAPYRLISEVIFGEDVVVHPFTNLYGCRIGARTRIGPFVEIQRGATVGSDCKVQSHAFVCDGVTIGDAAFIGHGVIFINDNVPRATTEAGRLRSPGEWERQRTTVARGASLGSGAVVLGGLHIGEDAIVGAGAVVTRDVPAGAKVAGNPARLLTAAAADRISDQLISDAR